MLFLSSFQSKPLQTHKDSPGDDASRQTEPQWKRNVTDKNHAVMGKSGETSLQSIANPIAETRFGKDFRLMRATVRLLAPTIALLVLTFPLFNDAASAQSTGDVHL